MRPQSVAFLCIVLAACGSSHPEPDAPLDSGVDCTDVDGDGYGVGTGCLGTDCDDERPEVHEGCTAECDEGSKDEGCPCLEVSDAEACYHGPEGTASIGDCAPGFRVCRDGAWSACEGEILPLENEVWCDYEDEDCDGVVDDGVQSACGDCNGNCVTTCAGVGCASAFVAGTATRVAGDGALESEPVRTPPDDLWALTDSGSVLRIDAPERAVVGRYAAGPRAGTLMAVVVDGTGDAYLLDSRSDLTHPSAVVAIRAESCPDRDGDGAVTTSVGELALDYGDDECVAWRTELESCDFDCSGAEGLCLAADGTSLWATLEDGDRAVELDPVTGDLTGRSFVLEGATGILDDGAGNLWAFQSREWLVRMEADDPDPESIVTDMISLPHSLRAFELAPDGSLFVGSPLARVDPDDLSVTASEVTTGVLALDEAGSLWTATDTTFVDRVPPELDADDAFAVPGRATSVAVDRAGDVWVTTRDPDAIVVLDAGTGLVVSDELADCNGCLDGRISFAGDPSGRRLERAYGPLWARGEGGAMVQSECTAGEYWVEVEVEVRSGRARVSVRAANTAEELEAQPWQDLGSFPPGERVAVEPPSVGTFHELRVQTLEPGTIVERVTTFGACLRVD